MKTIVLMICIGFITFVSGAESINEQIEKIQNVPTQERVELMNRLKLQIAAMNEAEREEALNVLQQKSSHKMNQFRHQNMNDGSGGQLRQRLNSSSGGTNRQQGRQ
jgi:hypothetical protein